VNAMKLLDGAVEDPRDAEIRDLAGQVRDLEAQLRDAQREIMQTRRESGNALAALRKQLSPLYRALQAVFGELDAAGVDDTVPLASTNTRTSAVWDAWKQKLSPACGQVIDALLIHGELNVQQICVAARMGKNTVYGVIVMLKKAGVINKQGGRFSLKQL
jgi:chromosome segregation ATPase